MATSAQVNSSTDVDCYLVDPNGIVYGKSGRIYCHRYETVQSGTLHLAFSVFLFDSKGEKLLMQKRTNKKFTFPGYWSNTCCSHPIVPEKQEVPDIIGKSIPNDVVEESARQRLGYELGIPKSQYDILELTLVFKIIYKAYSCNQWGESEFDYVFMGRLPAQLDPGLITDPNPDEVSEMKWVTIDELKQLAKTDILTPWFTMIMRNIDQWWGVPSKIFGDVPIITFD